jgi:hypothetical protein
VEESVSERNEDQGSSEDIDVTKMVPMIESIRYRKRAQSAEKRAGELAEQLSEANQRLAEMSRDLNHLQVEQKLTQRLAAAGATDLEAAVLMAKARMGGTTDGDMDACLDQLKKEKGYLFGGRTETGVLRKTAGVKDRVGHSPSVLERAATKATRTGKRADLQEYLKLRRKLT